MLEILEETWLEVVRSLEPEFLGKQRRFLAELEPKALHKSELCFEAGVPAPSPACHARVVRRLGEVLSGRLGVEIRVRILGPRGSPSSPEGPGMHPGNRTAWLLLEALAAGRLGEINPVYLYGPPGAGKSALVRWFQGRLSLPSACFKGLEFQEVVVRALRRGRLGGLRRSLLEARVFILDEVHRLRGKRRVQTELCTLMDEFLARKAQILFVGRHHPHRIHDLGRSLASRFLGGFTVEVRGRPGTTPEGPPSSFEVLVRRVAAAFGLEAERLMVGGRSRHTSLPRQVVAFLACKAGIRGAEVARRLGWRSSSTVHYARSRIRELCAKDPELQRLVESCG